MREKTMLKKAVAFVALDCRKTWCRLQWRTRKLGLLLWGLECSQADDLKGVVTPNGKFYSYGKPYHRMYFLGRIIKP